MPTTPAQVRAVREYLGADIPTLAALLGNSERTIRRWESGDTPIPDQVSDDLWDLIDAHENRVNTAVETAKRTGMLLVPRPVTGDHEGRAARIAAAQAWAAVPDIEIDWAD